MAPSAPEPQRVEAALAYLNRLARFTGSRDEAYKPGLERMHALLGAMGRPHETFPSIHVAGTNGKGSTASMVAAIATAAGRRVGLHTSPHLFHVTERLRIDGQPAPAAWLADAVMHFRELFDDVQPSFFEATVALSFLYFAEETVDLAVVEVGLGGRLDATNVLQPLAALITHIGLDHTELLGATLADIAREKAGIIKPGAPVLTAVQPPEAVAVLQEIADARQAPLHLVPNETSIVDFREHEAGTVLHVRTPLRAYPDLVLDLPGRHQARNAVLALRAAELLLEEVQQHPAPVYAGLRDVRRRAGLRGRLHVVQQRPLIVVDVAHNPEGLAAALDFVQTRRCRMAEPGRLYVLIGLLRDKDAAGMARLLAEANAQVVPAVLDAHRALPVEALVQHLEAQGTALLPAGTPDEALARFQALARPEDTLLVVGSHQLLAQLPALEGAR